LHDQAQIIKVSGEPIHAMDNHRIAAAYKAHHQF
jgi:hypothetical protein